MSTQASASLPPLDVSYEDDPRVLEQAATEDYSLHIVPRTWRMDRRPLTMAWYAVMTAFFYLYFAAFLEPAPHVNCTTTPMETMADGVNDGGWVR